MLVDRKLRGCRPLSRVRGAAALAIALAGTAALVGCASTDSTPPLFRDTDLPVTLTEFRLRLSDFTEYFVAVIADASETVIDSSEDQTVRRNAMEFRLRTLNMFLNALNKPDPVASLVDAWAFCLQLQQYVGPGGAGAELFGEQQAIIVAATDATRAEVEDLVTAVSQGPAPQAAAMVAEWAAEHPLSASPLVRTSSAVLLAEQLESRAGSPFAALGRLQSGIDELVAQYQRYISVMPRFIRWQSQLILHETLYDELDLGDSMATFDQLSARALELSVRAEQLFADLPDREELEAELDEALAEIEVIVEAERARLLAEVDRQRGLVFDDITAQREAAMADLQLQIDELNEELDRTIDEMFTRTEALVDDTLQQSFDETKRLMDQVFIRVLVLLLVLFAGVAGLLVLKQRLKRSSPGGGATDS